MKKIFKIIPFMVFIPVLAFPQNHEVGISAGTGISLTPQQGNTPVGHYDLTTIAINYYFTDKKSFFCFKTGLSLDCRTRLPEKNPYLRMPIGVDFRIGKRIELIGGTGLILNYRPDMNFDYLKKFYDSWEFNSGLEFSITEKIDINVMYQYNIDFSPMNLDVTLKTQGEYDIWNLRYSDSFFRIGLKYRLFSKSVTDKTENEQKK